MAWIAPCADMSMCTCSGAGGEAGCYPRLYRQHSDIHPSGASFRIFQHCPCIKYAQLLVRCLRGKEMRPFGFLPFPVCIQAG